MDGIFPSSHPQRVLLGNGSRSYVRAGIAHSAFPFPGRTSIQPLQLSPSDLLEFQMFLVLRKRQRQALQAESATAQSQHPSAATVAIAAPPGGAVVPAPSAAHAAQHLDAREDAAMNGSIQLAHPSAASSPPIQSAADFTAPQSQLHARSDAMQQVREPSSVAYPQAKRMHQCRFCPRLLSSSSNRGRHEREQHLAAYNASDPSQLQRARGAASGGRRVPSAGQKRSSAAAGLAVEDVVDLIEETDPGDGDGQMIAIDADRETVNIPSEVAAAASASMVVDVHRDHLTLLSDTISSAPQSLASDSGSAAAAAAALEINADDGAAENQMVDSDDTPLQLTGEAAEPTSVAQEETIPAAAEPAPAPAAASEQINHSQSMASASTPPAIMPSDSPFENMATERDKQLQEACCPFLQWLCQPPMTEVEALVKARRAKNMSQLQPNKLHLRFIFGLLLESQAVSNIQLEGLAQLQVCQKLAKALDGRNVGGARVHALFLLVKKVLTFLASQESARRGQFITPNTYSSFMFVDAVCSESSQRRKQDARNRALLGVQSSKALQKSQQFSASAVSSAGNMPPNAFHMPSFIGLPDRLVTSTAAVSNGPNAPNVPNVRNAPPNARNVPPNDQHVPSNVPITPAAIVASGPAAAASGSARAAASSSQSVAAPSVKPPAALMAAKLNKSEAVKGREDPSANELTTEQLVAVAKGSLAYLQKKEAAFFVHHLVTATLCLGMGPRSQVLRALMVGSSLVKQDDGRYWIRMLGEQNKSRKPTCFPLAEELTAPYDYYLETLRPQLLQQTGQQHDYVFFKKNGTAPRADFGELTSTATMQTIGEPKNPHSFRSAVVTAVYQTGATQNDMNMLAQIMAHDPATARNYYYRPQMSQAALETHERMRQVLQLGEAAPAASVSVAAPAASVSVAASHPQQLPHSKSGIDPPQHETLAPAAMSSAESSALAAEATQLEL